MHPKIIAVIVIMLLLVGCGRTTNPVLVAPSAVPVNESKPVDAPAQPQSLTSLPTLTNPTVIDPLALQTGSSSYRIKDHVTYSGDRSNPKRVALTFDDGPDAKYTDQILNLLKKQNVTATFFVIGEHAAAHKEVMKRIVSAGHEIGNHSWSHKDLTKLDQQQLEAEINKTDEIITSFTNRPSTLMRPPYGSVSQQVIEYAEKSHRIINWSVDTRDWEGITPDRILENVKKQSKPGAIILQHSAGGKNGNLDNTIQALPQIINFLKEHGYQFVTISNLIS
ncbi:polysaccharide deacetylase family protein [Paenibacillus sp. 1_12]|uniref:polysaccharide deacetylase family protein n=1 Tax=Paenibacillus sp. 1_12 TaxID=1566278 RepID=UPI0015A6B0CF|nr:polysaccharide deacetylase family protein [Paenibacillus sp. 1_12]